jgi:hypothetical protein
MKFEYVLGSEEITTQSQQGGSVYHISHIDTKVVKFKWMRLLLAWIRRLCARLTW